jgi:hypothetical protein
MVVGVPLFDHRPVGLVVVLVAVVEEAVVLML